MRTAVLRVVIDRDGTMARAVYESGVDRLRELGLEVVASPAEHLPDRNREIELIIPGLDRADIERYSTICADVFETTVATGVVTYISRGTDDDAQGILKLFNVDGVVERQLIGDDELVTVVLTPDVMAGISEGRLHTALVAALNCEVRIVSADRDASTT